jgi:hypothetical protein
MTSAALRDDVAEPGREQSALARQLRAVVALAVPATIFWHVGYWVLSPADPLGPVMLLLAPHRFLAMIETVGLAVVAAGLAVAINGPRSALYGPFGVAVGLVSVSVRGGSIDVLPLCISPGGNPWPIRGLIFELWLWIGLIGLGAVVGRWVESWFSPGSGGSAGAARDPDEEVVDSAAELRRALLAIVVTAVLGYVFVQLLAGPTIAPVLKGQVLFSVGAGFYLATAVTLAIVRLRSPLWLLISLALVASVAYVIAAPQWTPSLVESGIRLIYPGLARPLPIQYAGMGAAGILLAHLTTPGLSFLGRTEEAGEPQV